MLGYCPYVMHPDNLADIQQLALSLWQNQPVTSHQVMSFSGKANSCAKGHSQLWRLCHVFRVTCWLFIILLPTCFLLYIFPFQLNINWNSYLICNRVQFPCNFHFLMWLLLQMPHPIIGHFVFRVLVCHYELVDPGLFPCVGLLLPCRSFRKMPWCGVEWLSTYLVRWLPCIWLTALQKCICVIKVVQYLLFLPGWPARCWVWPASTVLLLFQHTFLTISMWRPVAYGVVSSPSDSPSGFLPLGSTRGGSADIFPYHSMPALLHLGNTTTFGYLVVEYLQPSLKVSGKVCVSSSCISSSSSVQVSGGTCQRLTLTFNSGGSMLDGDSLASHSSQNVDRQSLSTVPS